MKLPLLTVISYHIPVILIKWSFPIFKTRYTSDTYHKAVKWLDNQQMCVQSQTSHLVVFYCIVANTTRSLHFWRGPYFLYHLWKVDVFKWCKVSLDLCIGFGALHRLQPLVDVGRTVTPFMIIIA